MIPIVYINEYNNTYICLVILFCFLKKTINEFMAAQWWCLFQSDSFASFLSHFHPIIHLCMLYLIVNCSPSKYSDPHVNLIFFPFFHFSNTRSRCVYIYICVRKHEIFREKNISIRKIKMHNYLTMNRRFQLDHLTWHADFVLSLLELIWRAVFIFILLYIWSKLLIILSCIQRDI